MRRSFFLFARSSSITSLKSSILLAGLAASGITTVTEPKKSRNHTETMLLNFGAKIYSKTLKDGSNKVELAGNPILKGKNINVPCDPSSAAFLIVASIICPGSKIELQNIMVNKSRDGLFTTLKEEAGIDEENKRYYCLIKIRANVEKSFKRNPEFQLDVKLNLDNFRDKEKINMEILSNKEMFLTVYQYFPYEKSFQVFE